MRLLKGKTGFPSIFSSHLQSAIGKMLCLPLKKKNTFPNKIKTNLKSWSNTKDIIENLLEETLPKTVKVEIWSNPEC